MEGAEMERQFDHILKDGGPTRDFDVTPEVCALCEPPLSQPSTRKRTRRL